MEVSALWREGSWRAWASSMVQPAAEGYQGNIPPCPNVPPILLQSNGISSLDGQAKAGDLWLFLKREQGKDDNHTFDVDSLLSNTAYF